MLSAMIHDLISLYTRTAAHDFQNLSNFQLSVAFIFTVICHSFKHFHAVFLISLYGCEYEMMCAQNIPDSIVTSLS